MLNLLPKHIFCAEPQKHVTCACFQLWKKQTPFLCAFAKFFESDLLTSLCACLHMCVLVHLSICPANCLQGTARFPLHRFSWNLIWRFLQKSRNQIEAWLKWHENNRWFMWRSIYVVHLYLFIYEVSRGNVKDVNIMSCHTDAICMPGN